MLRQATADADLDGPVRESVLMSRRQFQLLDSEIERGRKEGRDDMD